MITESLKAGSASLPNVTRSPSAIEAGSTDQEYSGP